jgi:hypothetical protein
LIYAEIVKKGLAAGPCMEIKTFFYFSLCAGQGRGKAFSPRVVDILSLLFFCLLTTIGKAGNFKQAGKDPMKTLFFSLLIAAALASCSTQRGIQADFEKNFRNYNELVRWNQLEEAGTFPSDSISAGYKERLKAAKNVAVVDYRVMNIKYDEKKKEAEVKVEVDYYKRSTLSLKTVIDNQKWAYQGKEGKGLWRLMSLLPDFP